MTSPIDRSNSSPRPSFERVAPREVRAQASATLSTSSSNDLPVTDEAEAFEAVLNQAAGQLVRRLPTGGAAQAWSRWKPPTEALGIQDVNRSTAQQTSGSTGGSSGGFQAVGPGSSGSVFATAADAGEAVVNLAARLVELGGASGASDLRLDVDGTQLIQQAYRDLGVDMPDGLSRQLTMGVEVGSIESARPGDLVAFGDPATEVSMYAGNNRVLRATSSGEPELVAIDRSVAAIRRIVTPGSGVAPVLPSSVLTGTGSTVDESKTSPVTLTGNTLIEVLSGQATDAANQGAVAEVPFAELFSQAGERWNVDPALLAAVAEAESAFDIDAVSPAGAQGLMQFMPATAAEMNVDPWDPASAIDGAARYLRQSLDQFDDVAEAVASYNAGRGAVQRHGGVPPYPETQNYVRKVLDTWRNN